MLAPPTHRRSWITISWGMPAASCSPSPPPDGFIGASPTPCVPGVAGHPVPNPVPSPCRLTDADRKRLWEKRYYCHAAPGALPMLLASAPSWEWACLPDIYALLGQWSCMSHQDALGLLHAT